MGSLLENARRALTKTSASQIEEWVRCPRRWYNAQVLGLRTRPTEAMTRGTKIHAILEAHLLNQPTPADADPDHVKRVASALPLFPMPGKPGLEVEQWIEMPTYDGGPKIVGRYDAIDWLAREARGISTLFDDFDHGDGVEAINYDAKTTSDFRYAKTPAELSDNVQMGVYSKHVLDKLREAQAVGLRHVYVRTRGAARSMPVDVVVTREEVEKRHAKTLGLVREMGQAAREMPHDAQELPANTASCNAFGGCPYRRLCGLDGPVVEFDRSNEERFTDHAEAVLAKVEAQPGDWFSGGANENQNNDEKEKSEMSVTNGEDLMEKLRQRSAAKQVGAAPAPAKTEAKAPEQPKTPPKEEPRIAAPTPAAPVGCPTCAGKRYVKTDDPNAPPNSYVQCKTCGAAGTVPASVAAKVAPAAAPKAKKELTPEEMQKRYEVRAAGNGKVSTKEGDGEKRDGWIIREPIHDFERKLVADYEAGVAAARAKEKGAEPGEDGLTDETDAGVGAKGVVPPDAPSRVDGEDEPEEKPKATRKTKAAPKAAAAEAPAEAPTTIVNNHTTAPAPAVRPATKGPRIYVDCFPTKGADHKLAVPYEEWLAPLQELAASRACNAKTGQPQPVQDWRLAEYGSGEGLLAVAIREALPTLPEVVVVTGISKARGVFLECVVPGAALVVKGV